MTPLIVVILAVAWIVVLVPPLLRSRSDGRPSTSIGSFRQQLATLSRTAPERRGVVRPLNRPAGVPAPPRHRAAPAASYGYRSGRPAAGYPRPGAPLGYSVRSGRADVRRRRLNVLVFLLALAGTTALGGFVAGISALVAVNLVIDAVLVFYVYLLVQLRKTEEQRAYRSVWSQAA